MDKSKLIETLHAWINQRPGLEPGNYIRGWDDTEGRSAYRSESRSITKDLHQARTLLRYVELHDTITAEKILDACRGKRLQIKPVYIQNSGCYGLTPEVCRYELDYCTGQYWPTEYRRAVCSVLSSAIWDWLRDIYPNADGDKLRGHARRELGRPLASQWFA